MQTLERDIHGCLNNDLLYPHESTVVETTSELSSEMLSEANDRSVSLNYMSEVIFTHSQSTDETNMSTYNKSENNSINIDDIVTLDNEVNSESTSSTGERTIHNSATSGTSSVPVSNAVAFIHEENFNMKRRSSLRRTPTIGTVPRSTPVLVWSEDVVMNDKVVDFTLMAPEEKRALQRRMRTKYFRKHINPRVRDANKSYLLHYATVAIDAKK
eukprot:CFRG4814T1